MTTAAFKKRFSPEEYLALERKADFKSEYYDGHMTATAGASREHNLITLNLGAEISSQLRERPYEAFVSDMRVLIDRTGL